MSAEIPRIVERGDEPRTFSPSWGAYTFANDAVLENVLALFASLEHQAPGLPLLVIPFDDRTEQLERAAASFGYSLWCPVGLTELDRLGRRFYGNDLFCARGFRKLAAFAGPFDRFFFLDSDVLALSPLARVAAAIESDDADLVYFDADLDQVYRPGPFRDRLVASNDARGFNAGLFVARAGALEIGGLEALFADIDEEWTRVLVPHAEQPFLNLAADRLKLRKRRAHELMPGYCSTCWPAVGAIEFDGASYRLSSPARWDHGWRLFFAHWAGIRIGPEMPERALFESFLARGRERLAQRK